MGAVITHGGTLPATNADRTDFYSIIDSATISGLDGTNVNVINTAGKVTGASLTQLNTIPSAAGVIPVANLGTGTPDGTKYLKDDGSFTALAVASAASEAEMEAGTENGKAVTPLVAKHSPGVAKAWVIFDGTGANPITKIGGYNINGTIAKGGTGTYTINWDTDFADTNYCVVASCEDGVDDSGTVVVTSKSAGSITIVTRDISPITRDFDRVNVIAMGLQ